MPLVKVWDRIELLMLPQELLRLLKKIFLLIHLSGKKKSLFADGLFRKRIEEDSDSHGKRQNYVRFMPKT